MDGPVLSLYRFVGTTDDFSSFSFFFRYDCVLYGTFGVGEGVGVDDGCWLGKM